MKVATQTIIYSNLGLLVSDNNKLYKSSVYIETKAFFGSLGRIIVSKKISFVTKMGGVDRIQEDYIRYETGGVPNCM